MLRQTVGRRIDLVASEALRGLETRIAMRLSDWRLRRLVRVSLFESEHSECKQRMYRGYCKGVPNMKFADAQEIESSHHP